MQISSIAPLRSDFHVVPHGVYWEVKQEHHAFTWGTYLTKAEAVGEATTQARQGHVSLIVHGRDGHIQYSNNYENVLDPFR